MQFRQLGRTDLKIAPLVFGGNVFGWTADEKTSFSLLDQFTDAGFNAIDTADSYSRWFAGNKGGESETIIGNWLKANPAKRQKVLIFTKVGSDMGQGHKDLSAKWIEQEVEASLRRLQTDRIDLYQSHWPDPNTPYDETLGAYDRLLRAGKVRFIGTSNLDAAQLRDALNVAKAKGLPRYETLQPGYNLYDRKAFDGPLRELCIKEEIGVITYYSLASGFLSGKYRIKADIGSAKRGEKVSTYLDERGLRILAALDAVAVNHSAQPAEIALAWLIAREGVTAPIASATNAKQLDSLMSAVGLKLSAKDIRQLNDASRD